MKAKGCIAILILTVFTTVAAGQVSPPTQPQNLLPNPSLEQAEIPEHWKSLNVWAVHGSFRHRRYDRTFRKAELSDFLSRVHPILALLRPSSCGAGRDHRGIGMGSLSRSSRRPQDQRGAGCRTDPCCQLLQRRRPHRAVQGFRAHQWAPGHGHLRELKGSVVVPPKAATLRLRIGFRDACGTCWIDDVGLHAPSDLVLRSDLQRPRITPEMGGIPILIINRDRERGPAIVRARLGESEGSTEVKLDGEPTQTLSIPLTISARGDLALEIALLKSESDEAVFIENSRVLVPPAMVLSPAIPTHWAVEDGPPRVEADVDLAMSRAQRTNSILHVDLVDEDGKVLTSQTSSDDNPIENGFNRFYLPRPQFRWAITSWLLDFFRKTPWSKQRRSEPSSHSS